MRSLSSIPRSLLLTAAVVFAVTLIIYTGVWLYYVGGLLPSDWERKAELTPYITIRSVAPGSSAARAGLRVGDRILAVNGYPQHVLTFAPGFAHGKEGDVVTLRVHRPGVGEPFDLRMTLEAAPPRRSPSAAQWVRSA